MDINSPYAIINQSSKYYVVSNFKSSSIFSNIEFMGIVNNENGNAAHDNFEDAQKTIARIVGYNNALKEEKDRYQSLCRLIKTGTVISTTTI